MTHNFFELNSLIGDLLKANESFSLLRIDNTMGYVLDCLQKNQTPVREFYNENTLISPKVLGVPKVPSAFDCVLYQFLKGKKISLILFSK